MRGNAATGWALLVGGLIGAVLISVGLYRWDVAARAAEASLRPQPVAPLAAYSPAVVTPATAAQAPVSTAGTPAGGDAAAGQANFQTKCNPCHPSANAGIGPALHGQAFSDRYPDNAAVMAIIRGGRGFMPAFGLDQLTDQDLANVITYLRSLPAEATVAAVSTSTIPVPAAANPARAAAVANPSPGASPTPLSQQMLSSITPGLSSYMLETARRMGRSWFAGQAGNWDEAAFEIREARGVLQAGATRSTSNQSRQQGIQAFSNGFMNPLVDAAQAGDRNQYEQAYQSAIGGCNACHASQTYGAINQSFSFIRVQVPKTSIWDVYAYAR